MLKLKEIVRSPQLVLAFGFGSGLVKIMPGTVGTVAAIPLYIILSKLNPLAYLLVLIAAVVIGIYVCGYAAEKLGVPDHGAIVWDEFAGYWVTMFMVPFAWEWILAGFFLFRFFDILKPWPISWLDKHVHGGVGIMVDDILAGWLAAGLLHLIIVFAS